MQLANRHQDLPADINDDKASSLENIDCGGRLAGNDDALLRDEGCNALGILVPELLGSGVLDKSVDDQIASASTHLWND